jgi:FkbM family methyltransferase
MSKSPFIDAYGLRLLNVPGAWETIQEVLIEDCYNLKCVPHGADVVDVGAFYGEFGVYCAARRKCRVCFVEPVQESMMVCKANYSLNCVSKNAQFLNAAVSDRKGLSDFWIRPDHPAGSGLEEYDVCEHTQVKTITMSDVLDSIKESSHPIVVKMDCESAERKIFFGSLHWLKRVSVLLMEWHNHDGWLYKGILSDRGFDVTLFGGGPPPRPEYDQSIGGGILWAIRKDDE